MFVWACFCFINHNVQSELHKTAFISTALIILSATIEETFAMGSHSLVFHLAALGCPFQLTTANSNLHVLIMLYLSNLRPIWGFLLKKLFAFLSSEWCYPQTTRAAGTEFFMPNCQRWRVPNIPGRFFYPAHNHTLSSWVREDLIQTEWYCVSQFIWANFIWYLFPGTKQAVSLINNEERAKL